ncbi:MAG: hypothetical protein Q9184_003096 [Pyrenodesmia sp. 2 TL-2023]
MPILDEFIKLSITLDSTIVTILRYYRHKLEAQWLFQPYLTSFLFRSLASALATPVPQDSSEPKGYKSKPLPTLRHCENPLHHQIPLVGRVLICKASSKIGGQGLDEPVAQLGDLAQFVLNNYMLRSADFINKSQEQPKVRMALPVGYRMNVAGLHVLLNQKLQMQDTGPHSIDRTLAELMLGTATTEQPAISALGNALEKDYQDLL